MSAVPSVSSRLSQNLAIPENQIQAAITLIDEGSTVPFIARYRKEVTGGLDDTQLRNLEEGLRYIRELDERRTSILNSIKEQEKLTPALEQQINTADTKSRLEDLYLPYKQKRRTKAQIAREAGLEPLALSLLEDPDLDPQVEAEKYLNTEKEIKVTKDALDGAKQILMERFAEDAELLQSLRKTLNEEGLMCSTVKEGKEKEGEKFSDYFEFDEAIHKIPSHRALALFRGRNEGILNVDLKLPNEAELDIHPCESSIARHFQVSDKGRPADSWLMECVRWAWRIKLLTHLSMEILSDIRTQSEQEAISVFSMNLKDLLLAAPAGAKATLGLDPGLRTGVKVAVVDDTGKFLDHATIYPHVPQKQWDQSLATLSKLCAKHQVKLIAIGNGTASRETDKLAQELIKLCPQLGLNSLVVSEAGASVYSASEFASKEFPDLDVSIRGAVSIARRLQDPLAELVKIEPKAIGVGQYQHDLNQTRLARSLEATVEDCVNSVGVDLNMASAPLLARVSGLSDSMAENIVTHRNQNGSFANRKALLDVPRLGPKAFEQAAGFLRIVGGDNPLDRSAVHPEAYPVVEKIGASQKKDLKLILGDKSFLRTVKAEDFVDEQFGLPTIVDIIKELEKPGRDPRPEFKTAAFKEGVEELKDLKPDMTLEGVVTNVTNFGAFIDIGVHQDGLVHISALADKFVKDPREVVKAGDVVNVKVMEVDIPRKRISLTMRLSDSSKDLVKDIEKDKPSRGKPAQNRNRSNQNQQRNTQQAGDSPQKTAFASAFAKALKK